MTNLGHSAAPDPPAARGGEGDCRPIVVCGVAGSGKTTLGQALAGRIGGVFVDADDFHPPANVAKMRSGVPLDDHDRAPWLAALNAELHSRVAAAQCVVLACSALKANYRDRIAARLAAIDWIFLDGDAALIADRMRARSDHYMPESLLRSQFEALERPHDAICIAVTLTPDEQLNAALSALGAPGVAAQAAARPAQPAGL